VPEDVVEEIGEGERGVSLLQLGEISRGEVLAFHLFEELPIDCCSGKGGTKRDTKESGEYKDDFHNNLNN